MSISRTRVVYGLAATVVMCAGLGSRSAWADQHLPWFIAEYAGDALWTLLIYLAVGLTLPRIGITKLAVGVLLFAYAVEFSQLYQAPWINRVRGNPLGALALGKSFVWTDLPCYTVGVMLGVLFDLSWRLISPVRHAHGAAP